MVRKATHARVSSDILIVKPCKRVKADAQSGKDAATGCIVNGYRIDNRGLVLCPRSE